MCSRLHSAPSARDKAALKLIADVDPEKTAVKRLNIAGQRTGAVAAEHIGVDLVADDRDLVDRQAELFHSLCISVRERLVGAADEVHAERLAERADAVRVVVGKDDDMNAVVLQTADKRRDLLSGQGETIVPSRSISTARMPWLCRISGVMSYIESKT